MSDPLPIELARRYDHEIVAKCVRAARRFRRDNPDMRGPEAEAWLVIAILEAAGLEAVDMAD